MPYLSGKCRMAIYVAWWSRTKDAIRRSRAIRDPGCTPGRDWYTHWRFSVMTCRRSAALLIGLLPLGLVGCGGGDGKASGPASSQGGTSVYELCSKAGDLDKDAYFDASVKSRPKERTAHLEGATAAGSSSSATPSGKASAEGKISGDIDVTDQTNPKASLKISVQGMDMEMVMIDKLTYMKAKPLTGDMYLKLSMQEMLSKSGVDMQTMTDPSAYLEKAKGAVTKVSCVGREDLSGAKTARIRTTLDTRKAAELLKPSGSATSPAAGASSAMPETQEADQWVDEKGRLLKMDSGAGATKMTLTYSKWGEPVTITAPPATQVTQMPF